MSTYLSLYGVTDAILTLPQITYSVPYALISIRIESLGLGQGVYHFNIVVTALIFLQVSGVLIEVMLSQAYLWVC